MPLDSAFDLAERQGDLIAELYEGVDNGGLDEEKWRDVERRLPLCTMGNMDPRLLKALELFGELGLHRHPHWLRGLVNRLRPVGNRALHEYVLKSLVQLREEPLVTTMTKPVPLGEKLRRRRGGV
jgi:hypothetical protein